MTGTPVQKSADSGISLSLQSLIAERNATPHSINAAIQGLSSLTGQMKSRRRGQGLEFEDLRLYALGDDIRHIDWKVSARHNQLHTRIFREEKEQLVTLALDFTSVMFTGSHELKAVQAGRMAAHLAWQLACNGGRCGLLIQTDNGFHAVRPALGDRAALAICAQIAKQFELSKQHAKASFDRNEISTSNNITLFDRLLNTDRSSGAIVLLVGLNEIDSTFSQRLNELRIAKQFVVVNIEDPLEYTVLPSGVFRYKSVNGNTSIALSKKQSINLKQKLDQQNQNLVNVFAQAKVPLLQSRTGISKVTTALRTLGFLA